MLASAPASVQRDFAYARRFMPEMKRIIGEHLIVEAPPEEDMKHNTDLVVLRLAEIRIACRVRTNHYLTQARYRDQFTIRAGRPSGAQTELTKLISGWGQYILYGFADAANQGLAAWVLGDLNVFRLWYCRQVLLLGDDPGEECHNGDGSSTFRAYNISALPPKFVVARKQYTGAIA